VPMIIMITVVVSLRLERTAMLFELSYEAAFKLVMLQALSSFCVYTMSSSTNFYYEEHKPKRLENAML
jgi:hypothetical protein